MDDGEGFLSFLLFCFKKNVLFYCLRVEIYFIRALCFAKIVKQL